MLEQVRQARVEGHDFLHAHAQASTPAAPVALRAQQPAPQFGGFHARETGAEEGIRGVEQVVALVEDHVLGKVAFRSLSGLVEDERVVGDHQARVAGVADVLFDAALAVVRAAGIEALAALVGEVGGDLAAEQVDQPRRKVAADHVAVAAALGPARGDDQADAVAVGEAAGLPGFLQIEQAEVVLPALADHHAAVLGAAVGEQAVGLLVDLPLQGAGVGRDPDRALVLARPDCGGGEVAEGLAHSRAGFGEYHVGGLALLAGVEGLAHGRGKVGLRRAFLDIATTEAEQLGELGAGFGFGDRVGAGATEGGLVFPRVHPLPDAQGAGLVCAGVEGGVAGSSGEAPHQRLRPGPVRPCCDPDAGEQHAVGGAQPGCFSQQRAGECTQVAGLLLGRSALGQGLDIEGGREGARGRGDGSCRADEGEEFEHVERAEPLQPAATGQRRHMADQRGVFGQGLAEGLGAELPCALTGRTPPQAAFVPDQGGRCVDGQAFGAVEQVKHGESFMRFAKAWTAVVSMPEMVCENLLVMDALFRSDPMLF